MATGSGITVVIDGRNNAAAAFGSAAKGVKTVGEAADVAQRELQKMDAKLESAETKARKLAAAEEQAAEKARRLAVDLAVAKRELAEGGDETGKLATRVDRLSTDLRFAALATDEYRRSANRAASEAREQARAYDRVADNARQAARAVTLLGAASVLTSKSGGGAGFLGLARDASAGLLKGGIGGASSAVEGTLGTPIVGPALLAAGAAAAVPAATFAGAAAGGGVGLGLGAAGAGLGLAGAWQQDPGKFEAMWTSSIGKVEKRWLASSAAFGNELNTALKTADNTLQRLPVEKVLALSQSFVNPLVAGAGQGTVSAANGIADALYGVQKIADTVGPQLANLGGDVGDFFRMISYGSEGGSEALGDLVNALGYGIKATGVLILGFENAYHVLREFAGGIDNLAKSVYGFGASDIISEFLGIHDSAIVTARSLDDTSSSAHGAASSWGDWVTSAAEAQIEASELNDALTNLHNTLLAMANANLAVAQGWDDLKEELNDGAKSLDLSTQAGRDNEKAIIRQVGALEAQRQAAIDAAGGQNASQEAIEQANAAYAAQIEQLRQAAYAAGFDKTQVDNLIKSLGGVPATTTATVQVPGLSTALAQGESLRQRLDQIDGRHAEATVTVYYRSQGQSLNAPLRTGGIPHAAAGGAQGRDTLVGEEGPEIARLPTGTTMYPKANTSLMRAQGGSGQEIRVRLELTGSGALYEALMAAQRSGEFQILSSAIVD